MTVGNFQTVYLVWLFLSCLIYFVKTVIIIQQIIEGRLTSSVVQNDCNLLFVSSDEFVHVNISALINKVSENTKTT